MSNKFLSSEFFLSSDAIRFFCVVSRCLFGSELFILPHYGASLIGINNQSCILDWTSISRCFVIIIDTEQFYTTVHQYTYISFRFASWAYIK